MSDLRRPAVALALLLLTGIAFEGVRSCGFVGFDDPQFVSGNPYVRSGVTLDGLRWALGGGLAFPSPFIDYWAPLTALSRLVDGSLYGLRPAGHHLTNLFLHAASAALLFLVLEGLTGARWRSGFVAAVFAVHPLHVESVAWVAERKDVLSGLFFVMTLGAYRAFVRAPGRARYAVVVASFALGLLSKPMVMTLPFVLLLLDYWPLGRWPRPGEPDAGARLLRLVTEKVPLFALTALSLAATYLPLRAEGQLTDLGSLPLVLRLENAAYSCFAYAAGMVWPHDLAVVYPQPQGDFPVGHAVLGLGFVAIASAAALACRRALPSFFVGWLWYLGMLAPVLGLVQSGVHARADRYTYLPLIGLSIALTWSVGALLEGRPVAQGLAAIAAIALIGTWVGVSRRQVRFWLNTQTLFEHAVAVTAGNFLAHNNLASALASEGKTELAELHLREALRLNPAYLQARHSLGVLLAAQGRLSEAMEQHQLALRTNPRDANAQHYLGVLYARLGNKAEAARHYAAALEIDPGQKVTYYDWGNLLAGEGRYQEAEQKYAEAVRLGPDDVEPLNNLGLAQALQGKWAEAIRSYDRALAIDPRHPRARTNRGRALAADGRFAEAVQEYERALRAHPEDADAHFNLGVALQAAGDRAGAMAHFEEAVRLEPGFVDAVQALRAADSPEPTATKIGGKAKF
jgi:protein O-mannosyl-transferase